MTANGVVITANGDRFDKDHLVVEERIFFPFNSATLTLPGRAKLNDIADELKAAGPNWQLLRIEGYADQRGPKDYNQELSLDRAKAVAAYLKALGVKDGMLDTKAYGESRPLEIDASSPEDYQMNRRVEFTIVRAQ
jgi:outer membrane protein OmpA-like peptidoglycan-associated protein